MVLFNDNTPYIQVEECELNNGLYYLSHNERKQFKASPAQCFMILDQLPAFRQIVYSGGLQQGSRRIHLGNNLVMSTNAEDSFKKTVNIRTWYPNKITDIWYPIRRGICFKIAELNDFYLVLKELKAGYWPDLAAITEPACTGEHESPNGCEICMPNSRSINFFN